MARVQGPRIPMGYYPIFVEMHRRPCLVIGGGSVAERKVGGLLEVGAAVTVISPALTEQLQSWVREGRIAHVERPYREGDLLGYEMVLVATDDGRVNAEISREARERRVWINCADDPDHCDFTLPSVLRRGELAVAISSGGTSPALSRAIREELEQYFHPGYAFLAAVVAEVRGELKRRRLNPCAETWHRALRERARQLAQEKDPEAAKALLLRLLGAEQ